MSHSDDFPRFIGQPFRMDPERELALVQGEIPLETASRYDEGAVPLFGIAEARAVAGSRPNDVVTRARRVMEVVLRRQLAGEWPALPEWREALPDWFVGQMAPELPIEDELPQPRWWQLVLGRHRTEPEHGPWSLANWLYWLRPEHRQWYWLEGVPVSATEVLVRVAVPDWPVLAGSLVWLLETAGASHVDDPRLLR